MEWHKLEGYKGVRYREHETRKKGIKKDRYFAIRYRVINSKGKSEQHEEGLGWASDGWTAEKAAGELAKLKYASTP